MRGIVAGIFTLSKAVEQDLVCVAMNMGFLSIAAVRSFLAVKFQGYQDQLNCSDAPCRLPAALRYSRLDVEDECKFVACE